MKALLLSAAVLAASATAAAGHDLANWIDKGDYTGPDGSHCCGPSDCKIVPAEQVKTLGDGYHIWWAEPSKPLPRSEIVPYSEAHQSEDGQYWRCRRYDGSRRCFFAPQPSS